MPNIQNRFTFILLLISKIIHLQILLGIIQIFFNDFQGCAILTHFFQRLIHLLTNSSVILFCKSNTYPDHHQRIFQDTEACIIILHVLDNGFLMLATTSELPVRVTNALPMDVAAVVRLDPPDARLSAPTAVEVTVPAHGEASARVPVEAAGSGNLAVRVLLTTPSGTPLGTPESLDIRVRADWETRGTAVAGIVLTILVVGGIVRTAVRRRRGADG